MGKPASNEICENIQVNYYIIRTMWDGVNKGLGSSGHFEKNPSSLYKIFDTSKTSWDALVSGSSSIYRLKSKSEKLERETSIPKEVFAGEVRITFGGEIDEELCEYFKTRNERLLMSNKKEKDAKIIAECKKRESEYKNKFYKYFKTVDPDITQNPILYSVCYFVKNKRPAITKVTDESSLLQLISILEKMKVKDFDGINEPLLKEYRAVLGKQYKLVDSICICRENQ